MVQVQLARISRDSRRIYRVLNGLLPLVVLLAGALLLGGMKILDEEKARLDLDFKTLVAYIHEQELFLDQLRQRGRSIQEVPVPRTEKLRRVVDPANQKMDFYEGQVSIVDLPFSGACALDTGCSMVDTTVWTLGTFLSDFFASFWSSSSFPASVVFLMSKDSGISISVPALDTLVGNGRISAELFSDVIRATRRELSSVKFSALQDAAAAQALGRGQTRWFSLPDVPQKMIGVLPMDLSPAMYADNREFQSGAVATTLFSLDRLKANQAMREDGTPGDFWLVHKDGGVLLGKGAAPDAQDEGLSLNTQGILWKGVDSSGIWTGIYRIRYADFFADYQILPIGAALAVLFVLVGGIWYSRWYRTRVIEPALAAELQIRESEVLSRTLIQTAPIGLCVLNRETGKTLFSNAIAEQWLGLMRNADANGPPTPLINRLRAAETTESGTLNRVWNVGGREVSVASAPTWYHDQPVTVCAFIDLTERVEIEQELARAKQAADDASESKSLFLSTMSHEIRTPLHGLQGTLELLMTTTLDARQRQYVNRLEDASELLSQLISDILDMSKIEAGQLALEVSSFSPLELTQSCVSAYAAMAYRKHLLIFSCIDPEVPAFVMGDAVRIRQILSNLISNAIKFTDVGSVIVYVRCVGKDEERVTLQFEVRDTGRGIKTEHQSDLFEPFFVVEGSEHTTRGAGLGLSICERLARLMGSRMQFHSEHHVGSSFSFTLDLTVDARNCLSTPDLNGCELVLRTPHDELTGNLQAWLSRWGAQVRSADELTGAAGDKAVWLDLFTRDTSPPTGWAGRYLNVDATEGDPAYPDIDGQRVLSIGEGLKRLSCGHEPWVASSPAFHSFACRVLVAEDNPINQMTLRDQLEQLGCTVEIAEDGEDALAIWDRQAFDIVLTDINMPRLNGYELAQTLRAEGVVCPIVGITANAMLDEQRRCIEAGMNACLVKPISLQVLSQVLRQYSPKRERADAVIERAPQQEGVPEHGQDMVPAKFRDLFLTTMQEDVEALAAALGERHRERIVFSVHRMSGALSQVGAAGLAIRLGTLEERFRLTGLTDETLTEGFEVLEDIRALLAGL